MDRAVSSWIETIERTTSATNNDLQLLRPSYSIYGRMLLLAHNTFDKPRWQELSRECTNDELDVFYEELCKRLNISHIAINKPIPLLEHGTLNENHIRAPKNFMPLHGDFGPDTCTSPPTQQDLDAAFWVTAKQYGIFQTWAPRWTMFSRGNINEKARLLTLPSVVGAVEQGRISGAGCTAVDLYAGIGYFAFSYLKAGVDSVLCWDLNPWSIEGLRRGAKANKWTIATHNGAEKIAAAPTRLLVFNESNEHAPGRVQRIRNSLPPIRHVNCGFLPTSRGSWQTAVDVLDSKLGGWVHVHENFGVEEINGRAEDVRATVNRMVGRPGHSGHVQLDHIHKLKTYAPGVMHCVIDIYIPPVQPG